MAAPYSTNRDRAASAAQITVKRFPLHHHY
jgi:hypothetical protein